MNSSEIRRKYLSFFEKRGHKVIPSSSLVPEGDSSSLFISAGMQPLVPYLLGQTHPLGTRLVNAQKCIRTVDIEEVGDNRHLTFFEMLGNWSLGDYFKEEALKWSFEFLTSKDDGLGLEPARLYVTVFKGESGIPRDNESIEMWKKIFRQADIEALVAGDDTALTENVRIIPLGVEDNFWIAGETGPCGADTEIFYDTTPHQGPLFGKFEDKVASFRLVEIWNNVFMEFNKTIEGKFEMLNQKNVDTGMGLERTTAAVNGQKTVFDIDMFTDLIAQASKLSTKEKNQRIIADHFRAAIFMIVDGIIPSNSDRGYVLRRLLRRAVTKTDQKKIDIKDIEKFISVITKEYESVYNLNEETDKIKNVVFEEVSKFDQTLKQGLREFELYTKKSEEKVLSSKVVFDLYQTFGLPIEVIKELAVERNMEIKMSEVEALMEKHQKLSRSTSTGMFKGGLSNVNERTVKLHTAHHLLLAALQEILGKEVKQRGSNITDVRLRIDFSFPRKLSSEELEKVELIVNNHIEKGHDVVRKEMPLIEAESMGAEMEFGAKYPEIVSLYFIKDKKGSYISKEFCGGPHVSNTRGLGKFKIIKEEAVSSGIRRIKAALE